MQRKYGISINETECEYHIDREKNNLQPVTNSEADFSLILAYTYTHREEKSKNENQM